VDWFDQRVGPRVELLLGGVWTDITPRVLARDGLQITRGRSDEGSQMDPSKCRLTINNGEWTLGGVTTVGDFSPRNPLGRWYGLLGRNTPLRVSVPYGDGYMRVPSDDPAADYASAPDTAGLSITGDIDVRIDLSLADWTVDQGLCSKYVISGDQRSWALELEDVPAGYVVFYWSTDGTFAGRRTATSTAPLPITPHCRLAVRATLDVNNGAGGNTVTFYYSDTISGNWTQLGSPVVGAGTTSIFDSTAQVAVGYGGGATSGQDARGKIFGCQVLSGIGGTAKGNPDFAAQTPGTTTFTDDAGNVWTLHGDAAIDDRDYRFWGEVSSWPQRWNTELVDVYVPVEASGITRRLGQGSGPIRSTMYREHANPARTHIVAYWPCEDDTEATSLESGLAGKPPMRVSGVPTLASYSGWTASDALPKMDTGKFVGPVIASATGELSVRAFVFVDDAVAAETSLLYVRCTGTAPEWDVRLTTAGDLRTRAFDPDGASLVDVTGVTGMNSKGFTIIDLELTQVGSDISWARKTIDITALMTVNDAITVSQSSGTVSGATIGRCTSVTVGNDQTLGNVIIGHVAVADAITAFAATSDALAAQNGEHPLARLRRLCAEEEIPFVEITKNESANTVTMGDQKINKLLDLFTEVEDSDFGRLFEPRDAFALGYRNRISLYNQAAVELDYSKRQLAPPLEPVDDDQRTVNDVTVTRVDGGKYRAEQTTGPLSTAEPPDGVGRYDASVNVSLETDDQIPDQAGWRLHLGTTDEARYPQLSVNFAAEAIARDPALAAKLSALDLGDRVAVTNPPVWLPPDDITQLIEGSVETIGALERGIVFNCAPAFPWDVGVVGDTAKRAATDGSGTVTDFDAGTGTALTVATTDPDAPVWVDSATYPADFPLHIKTSGVELEVTAVTGYAEDGFGRSTAGSWGNPDIGPAYTLVGTAADFAVGSGFGSMTLPTTGSAHLALLAAADPDFDFYCDVATSALATGASLFGGLVGRAADNNNLYTARVEFTVSGAVILSLRKRVTGTETSLASFTAPLTHVAGTFYRARMQGAGSTVRAKVWAVTAAEPAAWQTSATDTDLTAAANLGARSFSNTGNTNSNPQVRYDNLTVINPQIMTVTAAPVNGVTKTVPAGSDVQVAYPFRLAL
jgi:hypothetical protein